MMMRRPTKCPVCLDAHGATSNVSGGSGWAIDCNVCGRYRITCEAFDDELMEDCHFSKEWTAPRRASLSHALLTQRNVPVGEHGLPELRSDQLE